MYVQNSWGGKHGVVKVKDSWVTVDTPALAKN